MKTVPRTILLVDDEPSMLRYMQTVLELESYKVQTATNGKECIARLERDEKPDLIFLDLLMPELDGMQTLERMREMKSEVKVVMLSCVNETAKVVQCMKLGAQDYLTKPFEKHELDGVLQRCIAPKADVVAVTCEVEELSGDLFFLAGANSMKRIQREVGLVANIDIPVLLLGESGTGKEIIARLIHKKSARAHRPFMKVNCAALPADLLESELFGYEAGAFTGAHKSKPGKFEMAHKGTILLDEIGEMSAALQAKLLHVLQDGTFSRLGGRANVTVDARVLAATNIDVKKAIAERRLREDLYYRLNAFTVTVPALRERREEIPILLRYYMNNFARQFGKNALPISEKLVQECMRYAWPGNLRELGNL